jgi:hypothetical protein
MKCAICKKKVEKTFLDKVVGTYYNKKLVCRDCQLLGDGFVRKKLRLKKL